MKGLPDSDLPLVLRTDFSDEAAWGNICKDIEDHAEELATVEYVSDPEYDGLSISDLLSLAKRGPFQYALFVVDQKTLTDPEHPILALDLTDEPGRTFRVIPQEIESVSTNFWLRNMDFHDFADNTDTDGVFRGFPEG